MLSGIDQPSLGVLRGVLRVYHKKQRPAEGATGMLTIYGRNLAIAAAYEHVGGEDNLKCALELNPDLQPTTDVAPDADASVAA